MTVELPVMGGWETVMVLVFTTGEEILPMAVIVEVFVTIEVLFAPCCEVGRVFVAPARQDVPLMIVVLARAAFCGIDWVIVDSRMTVEIELELVAVEEVVAPG